MRVGELGGTTFSLIAQCSEDEVEEEVEKRR